MLNDIRSILLESAEVKRLTAETINDEIAQAARLCINSLQSGGKITLCGNGGSAADAQHLAGELVGRFLLERPGYAGLALTTDTSILTAIGNDYGFDEVFSRQVEGLLKPEDVLIALSTSGNAADCVRAVEKAIEIGAKTIGMTGEKGGRLAEICDVCLKIPSSVTARIQETHITIGHILCLIIERELVAGETV